MASSALQAFLDDLATWVATQSRVPQTYRYGSGSEQEADLYLPDGDGPHPVVVILHGGFWRAPFTRAIMAALAIDLADRGWAAWNVEYRRVGNGGGIPETLEDVRAAIDALPGLDAQLGYDQVVVLGHSAGGQLALCVADMQSVAAVVALAGVCDLTSGLVEGIGQDAVREFMGGDLDTRADAYALADPLGLLPSGVNVLLVHGDADDRVPIEQSRRYGQAARALGDRCELLELPGDDHFALIDPRSQAWARLVTRLKPLLT